MKKTTAPSSDPRPPPLPTAAAAAAGLPTPAQHAIDLANARAVNAQPGAFGYRSNWAALGKSRRDEIANARMIEDGGYGDDAPSPCKYCADHGYQCHWYHPVFYSERSLGARCSMCRLNDKKKCTLKCFKKGCKSQAKLKPPLKKPDEPSAINGKKDSQGSGMGGGGAPIAV